MNRNVNKSGSSYYRFNLTSYSQLVQNNMFWTHYVFELVMGRFLIVSISLQIPNSPGAVNKALKFNPERAF